MKRSLDLLRTVENNIADATLNLRLKMLEKKTGVPGLKEAFHKALYAGSDMAPIAVAQGVDENGVIQTFTLCASSYISDNARSYGLNMRVTLETPFHSTPVAEVNFRANGTGAFNTVGLGLATIDGKIDRSRHTQIDAMTSYVQNTFKR